MIYWLHKNYKIQIDDYFSATRIFLSLLNSSSQSSSSLSRSYSTNSPISARAASNERWYNAYSWKEEYSQCQHPSKLTYPLLLADTTLVDWMYGSSPFHMYPQPQTQELVFLKQLSWKILVGPIKFTSVA